MTGRHIFATFACALFIAAQAQAQEPPAEPDTDAKTDDKSTPESDSPAANDSEESPPPGEASPASTEKKEPAEAPKDEDTSKDSQEDDDDDLLEDDDDDFDEEGDGGWDDDEPEPTFPRVELRGYFRFRADMFGGADLGTSRLVNNRLVGTSGFRPPATQNLVNNADPDTSATVGSSQEEDFLASANMRLRLQPSFHVTESLKFAATFDVLDNLVLGSTPDFDPTRPDIPLAAFSGSQAPPGSRFQFQDSIQVKELYGEWRILGMPLRFGRMASQWGLGMVANDGEGWDHDFGDYQDRVMAAFGFMVCTCLVVTTSCRQGQPTNNHFSRLDRHMTSLRRTM